MFVANSQKTFLIELSTWAFDQLMPRAYACSGQGKITGDVLDSAGKYGFDLKKLGDSGKGDQVLIETLTSKGNITSKFTLNSDEALDTGLKWVGDGYKEIGAKGSGVFRSADGKRQLRIDNGSLGGSHPPGVPHIHFETYKSPKGRFEANNHVPLKD